MRLLVLFLVVVALALAGAAQAQTVAFQSGSTQTTSTQSATTQSATVQQTSVQPTVTATPVIDGATYQTVNPVTYFKTATGLLVVLSPAALSGTGSLRGQTEGLTLEIPDSLINQLFF
ncbi:MAG: hypothetical protein HY795_04610 [Desulfovibrio sp.]|nr:hypothetical protein [Desulfovibrio sp.]MBI4960451.1 hypothetical protein [Desulfovibrio sp.]